MSTREESARVAGTCLLLGALLLGLAACRQAVEPPTAPDPYAGTGSAAALGSVSITWRDGPDPLSYEPVAAVPLIVSGGAVLDMTDSGAVALSGASSGIFSVAGPGRLVFTEGPDHLTTWAMRLDRDRGEVVIEDGAGRELARGVEVGERTDGYLVLRDRRGWEVWRSTDPCPPVWSRLPR